jgi:hypothetical protein
MRLISHLAAIIVALSVAAFTVFAQGRGNGQAKKPATQTTRTKAESPKAKAHTTKTSTKTDTRTVKAEARTAKANAKAETRAAKADTKATRNGTVSTTPMTPVADVTPTTPTSQPVKNPKLEARLLKLLPPDTTMQDAMAGFKNWGQFVAAVHVSNNLAIPFADLKARMTGITPGPTPGTTVQGTPMSLGQAIQSFKGGTTLPEGGTTLTTTQINREVKKAEDAANTDLRQIRERS